MGRGEAFGEKILLIIYSLSPKCFAPTGVLYLPAICCKKQDAPTTHSFACIAMLPKETLAFLFDGVTHSRDHLLN